MSLSNIAPSFGDAINCSDCTIINEGYLMIDSVENRGINMRYLPGNTNSFTNGNSGQIFLSRIGSFGIRVERDAVFDNEDGSLLQISNGQDEPLFIDKEGIFTGFPEIIIQNE